MSPNEGVSKRGWRLASTTKHNIRNVKKITFFRKLKNVVTNITVEPALLLFAICGGFFYIASKNLYIQKVCKVNLNFGYASHPISLFFMKSFKCVL